MRKLFFLWLILAVTMLAEMNGVANELRNIALGCPYSWSAAPNYLRSTDSGDAWQLTDGEKRGAYWIFSSVCWQRAEVQITIDLGLQREFDMVNIHTRSPGSSEGCHWALEVTVSVSDDGREFKQVGAWDKSQMDWPEFQRRLTRLNYSGASYVAKVLVPRTKGRYVRIGLAERRNKYITTDEIEVLSSAPPQLTVTSRLQRNDGGYDYAVRTAPGVGSGVVFQGLTPWNEVLLKQSAVTTAEGSIPFTFHLPNESCHRLRFDLIDIYGVVIDRTEEWISYSLPTNCSPSEIRPLTQGWTYQLRNPHEDYASEDWKPVALEDQQNYLSPFASADDQPETLWYRVVFHVEKPGAGEIRLRFGRIRFAPSIYVNGTLAAGDDLDPTMPHVYDITLFVREGKNELIVKVNDWRAILGQGPGPLALKKFEQFKKETWFALDPTNTNAALAEGRCSWIYPLGDDQKRYGILDRVELEILPLVHVGTVRVTPSVSRRTLTIDAELRNASATPRRVSLASVVGDTGDPEALRLQEREIYLPPRHTKLVHIEAEWHSPTLWWPRAPHLYRLCLAVRDGEEMLHTREERFGFREVAADGATLRLNGRPLHLFGTHDSANFGVEDYAELRGLAELNFNTRRTWGGCSDERLLLAADEMGFFVIDEGNHFNHYVQAGQQFWDNCFKHFQRRASRNWNHPSVIAYSTQNEYTCFSTPWAPPRWTQQRMDELVKRMIRFDPSRLHGHEGSFNTCRGFSSSSGSETVMLPHYAAEGHDNGEFLLPNHYTRWLHTLCGSAWEDRPLYLGEMGLGWDFRSNLPDASTMYNLDDQVFRGFRSVKSSFDVRAVAGFMPMEIDAMRHGRIAGLSPNAWNVNQELKDITRRGISPFYVHTASRMRQLTAGRRSPCAVAVYNDWLDGAGSKLIELEWELSVGGKVVQADRCKLDIDDGDMVERTLELTPPTSAERQEARLLLRLRWQDKTVFEREEKFAVFPPELGLLSSAKPVVLHDPTGKTANFLAPFGLAMSPVDFDMLDPNSILIVGEDGVDENLVSRKAGIQSFVERGGVAIALAQNEEHQWVPLPLDLDTEHSSTINYVRSGGHPVLRGLAVDDLKFWGSDNIAVLSNYKKPVTGGFRTIADTAGVPGLRWSPLLEIPCGSGAYLLCQFQLIAKTAEVPASGVLLRNLIDYANQIRPTPAILTILEGARDGVKALLAEAGVPGTEVDEPPTVPAPGVLVLLVDGQLKVGAGVVEGVKAFAANGGTVILHTVLPDSPWISLLPAGVVLQEVKIDDTRKSVIRTAHHPLTWGLSNQSLYWIGAAPSAGVTVAPWPPSPEIASHELTFPAPQSGIINLLAPALLVRIEMGKGCVLVDQIQWEDTKGSNRLKALEYLRILFVNLNVPVVARVDKAVRSSPVDLAPFCNRGFADEAPGDGKGGWTDQGPTNDLRSLPVGQVTMRGVTFNIVDPARNNAKSCIVLKSTHSEWGIEKAEGIPVNRAAAALHFLHASAWTQGSQAMATYVINYVDGTRQEIPVLGQANIGEWWKPQQDQDLPLAILGWTGTNPSAGTVGLWLFRWQNPFPGKKIATLDVTSLNSASIPCLVAVSAEEL